FLSDKYGLETELNTELGDMQKNKSGNAASATGPGRSRQLLRPPQREFMFLSKEAIENKRQLCEFLCNTIFDEHNKASDKNPQVVRYEKAARLFMEYADRVGLVKDSPKPMGGTMSPYNLLQTPENQRDQALLAAAQSHARRAMANRDTRKLQ
ncbi:unnamed protein product, partial [Amoebophrya sp. A25]